VSVRDCAQPKAGQIVAIGPKAALSADDIERWWAADG